MDSPEKDVTYELGVDSECSNDIQCIGDLIVLDEVAADSSDEKKKKKRKRKKNKKINKDEAQPSESGFIVLDSTGFSSQSSDKEKGEINSQNVVEDSKKEDVNSGTDIVTPRRKNSLLDLFRTPQSINCDDLFQIDTTPSTKDFVAVPKYQSKYDAAEAITGSEAKAENDKPKPRGGGMCWNCGCEGHQIRDCKKRRNPMMINKFRMEANAKRAFRNMQSRYHEDEGTKYGTPIPGVPSKKLRKALGIEDDQLPAYIYRMRVLGYPPGWLEEAKVHHSGMNMFDSNGQAVSDPNDEDGEIVNQGERDKFDLNKLVEFPGFNVPPPKNTTDQTEEYNVPAMVSEQSLESLIAALKPKAVQAYRKRKLAMSAISDDYDCDYMDTEEIMDGEELPPDSCKFVPCPPPEEPPAPPPPPSDLDEKEEGEEEEEEGGELAVETEKVDEKKEHKSGLSSRSESPSLTQLEKYKIELLSQLNTTSSSGAHRTPVTTLGKIKSKEQGTPVLKLSPYSQLPSFDKFQKNVSDVINFENLPDSTGKYKKLIPLIHRVKKVMSKINESS